MYKFFMTNCGLVVSLFVVCFSVLSQTPAPLFEAVDQDPRFVSNAVKLPPDDKVYGGLPVSTGQFTGVVGLAIVDGPTIEMICSGSLIAPKVVLTAKHCICRPDIAGAINTAVLGKDKTGRRLAISKSIPQFSDCAKPVTADDLDVALMILANPVSNVELVQFATSEQIDKAFSYRAVGFGLTDEKNKYGTYVSDEKRHVVVPSASNDCAGSVPGWNLSDAAAYGCKKNAEIVAGAIGLGRDTCSGDSGGPLLVGPNFHGAMALSDKILRVAGITSRGIRVPVSAPKDCGNGGIYVRVTDTILKWIAENSPQ